MPPRRPRDQNQPPRARKPRRAPLTTLPITEAFGYAVGTPQALAAKEARWCPFAQNPCEKFVQYGYGNCSVTYAAAGDEGVRHTYAVCDHRVDGVPLDLVVEDYFGEGTRSSVQLVAEVSIGAKAAPEDEDDEGEGAAAGPDAVDKAQPGKNRSKAAKNMLDYAAVLYDAGAVRGVVGIETQAVDIRGGGVGPAWQAWWDGKPDEWRAYFTREAQEKGRKDTVSYGVNRGNVYKRLGVQIALKGTFLKGIGVPLYVVMQDRIFQYLRSRIRFTEAPTGTKADITFMLFDYQPSHDPVVEDNGMLRFGFTRKLRVTLDDYVAAMFRPDADPVASRVRFLSEVRRKVELLEAGPAPEGGRQDVAPGLTPEAGPDLFGDLLSQ